MIRRYLTFPILGKIYERYLAHIPDLLDPKRYDPGEIEDLKQNTQESLVHLLGLALGNKALFADIFETSAQTGQGPALYLPGQGLWP